MAAAVPPAAAAVRALPARAATLLLVVRRGVQRGAAEAGALALAQESDEWASEWVGGRECNGWVGRGKAKGERERKNGERRGEREGE